MSFVKKVFHQALKCYYYVFPLAAFLIPLRFFSHFSDNYYPSNYQYFICSIIFSLGWFCVILCKERQLKAAASQLLQAKIRKIMEQDEGLRKVCASVEENRRESLQLRARNQELSSQLLLARNAFIKTKTEFQQLEGLISQLKEENQCLHLQLDALSQECGEKDREGQRLHRELTDALAYQQILNEEYQATFEEQHNMLDMRQAYIAKLDDAINLISENRSSLGAYQNRLTSASNNLTIMNENYEQSKSQIMDVDMAEESANMVKYQILQQTSATMLSQANQIPSIALTLLGA